VVLTASAPQWWSVDEFDLYTQTGAAPAITSAATLGIRPGTRASFTVTTSGSPTPALTESGALPAGVTFQANTNGTATISGTPPANATGTYHVTLTATNGVGSPAVQYLVITLSSAPPVITSPASVRLQRGVYSSFTVTTTGSPTPVLTESGTLPPGLAFRSIGDGTATIYGTPASSATGAYQVTITAGNGVGSSSQVLVMSFGGAPAITSAASLVLQAGAYRAFTVTTSGSPTPVLTESGTLPQGLVFRNNSNGTATIYGTPPSSVTGTYQVAITAFNGVGSPAVQYLEIRIGHAPAITSAASLVLHRGAYGTFTVTTSGSPTPVLTESGSLPPGLVFRNNGNGTATIYGTPPSSATGTYRVAITATNGVGSPAVQVLGISFGRAPAITSAASLVLHRGAYGTFAVTTSGSPTPEPGVPKVLHQIWDATRT
jgi:hypothetical protein